MSRGHSEVRQSRLHGLGPVADTFQLPTWERYAVGRSSFEACPADAECISGTGQSGRTANADAFAQHAELACWARGLADFSA